MKEKIRRDKKKTQEVLRKAWGNDYYKKLQMVGEFADRFFPEKAVEFVRKNRLDHDAQLLLDIHRKATEYQELMLEADPKDSTYPAMLRAAEKVGREAFEPIAHELQQRMIMSYGAAEGDGTWVIPAEDREEEASIYESRDGESKVPFRGEDGRDVETGLPIVGRYSSMGDK